MTGREIFTSGEQRRAENIRPHVRDSGTLRAGRTGIGSESGMARLYARTSQFACAGGRLNRQDFLHFPRKMRKIQPGAEANLNDPATQANHHLPPKFEEFPTRKQPVGQKWKNMIAIKCHYQKRVKLTWQLALALFSLADNRIANIATPACHSIAKNGLGPKSISRRCSRNNARHTGGSLTENL